MRNNRVHLCWKNSPTWLCNISFNNVICSTQGSKRNKAEGLVSAPIPFLEGRRGGFHVPLCVEVFHAELPVPHILKLSGLSGDFTVLKQTKIHLEINNHTVGRPQDSKRSVFLQGEAHPGLWVLSSTSQAFLQIWALEKSQTYQEKQKNSRKKLLLLEMKCTESGFIISQSQSHFCCLNCKMKIIWNMNTTILDLPTKRRRDTHSYHGQHSAPPPREKWSFSFGLGT